MRLVFRLLFFGLLASCASREPPELLRLEKMAPLQARAEFLNLSPDLQVKIVSWELENRRPASSKFDFLLQRNGEKIASPLLDEASTTRNFDVYITLMGIYTELPASAQENERRRAVEAISRCDYLGGANNEECRRIAQKINPHGPDEARRNPESPQ